MHYLSVRFVSFVLLAGILMVKEAYMIPALFTKLENGMECSQCAVC